MKYKLQSCIQIVNQIKLTVDQIMFPKIKILCENIEFGEMCSTFLNSEEKYLIAAYKIASI